MCSMVYRHYRVSAGFQVAFRLKLPKARNQEGIRAVSCYVAQSDVQYN